MTTEITVSAEVSVLLSPEGVDLYVGDDFDPSNTYSFDWLVNEFLDTYGNMEEFNEELETLASSLENMAAKIREAI